MFVYSGYRYNRFVDNPGRKSPSLYNTSNASVWRQTESIVNEILELPESRDLYRAAYNDQTITIPAQLLADLLACMDYLIPDDQTGLNAAEIARLLTDESTDDRQI